MAKTGKEFITVGVFTVVSLLISVSAYASGIVTDGTTELADAGSSSAPAQWWLNHNFTSTDPFFIGSAGKSYNQLTVDNMNSFTALNDFQIGSPNSFYNQLNIQQGGHVRVDGNVYNGVANIMYYSNYNEINISGADSILTIGGNLDISDGYNATDNKINLTDGGRAVVDGDFLLYNHWSHGNSWMELNGGSLFLAGDKTADFASGSGILSSIKVWDDLSTDFQRVAYYNSGTLIETTYFDMLAVDYINDAAMASTLGLSNDLIGYTVVRNSNDPVPEPATLLLFSTGILGLMGARRRKNMCCYPLNKPR
jgi:hypothetical protein